MENHALDPIIVLRVKTSCCKACHEKLQRGLQMIEGVHQVSIDPEKNLVSIRGNVDPFVLVKAIAKIGQKVELMYYDKEPKIEEDHHHHHHHHHMKAKYSKEKHPHNDDHDNPESRQNGREKNPYFCCQDEDLHPPKMEDFTHEARENRGVPKRDDEEDIFKHSYFRFQRNGSTSGREHLRRAQSARYETQNPQYSHWFSEESAPYEHYHSRMPPAPGPPPPSYPYGSFADYDDNFTHYFNDYNTSSCIII